MGERLNDIHRRANLVHAQITAFQNLHKINDGFIVDPLSDDSLYMHLLNKLYGEEYALANLWERSDIIVHAEGPAASKHSPNASIVSWLIDIIDKNMKKLVTGAMQLPTQSAKNLHLNLTGFAPGSIYAGFSLEASNQTTMFDKVGISNDIVDNAKGVISLIPKLPSFIGKESINQDITDFITDPLIRDSAILAAFNLSPTGRKGIHTLEFTSPKSSINQGYGELNPISRSILRIAAEDTPIMSQGRQKKGSFIGEFRGVDLDKSRLDLRNIDAADIGTLRCFIGDITPQKAATLLGKRVEVTGVYETLSDGRPRFMRVHSVREIEDLNLDFEFE